MNSSHGSHTNRAFTDPESAESDKDPWSTPKSGRFADIGEMGDDHLRNLERRWKVTGALADEASFLAEKVRVGSTSSESLRLAGHLGYPAAISAGKLVSPGNALHNQSEWHDATRSALARRLLYGTTAPLPNPGKVSLDGVKPGTRGEWFPYCRGVYQDLLGCEQDAFRTVLAPWVLANDGDELIPAHLRQRSTADNSYEISDQESWSLYALNRVNDFLLISFQSSEEQPWTGATVSLAEYWTFFEQLGLTLDVHERFHPFHHEIVEVDQAEDPDEPIALVDVL